MRQDLIVAIRRYLKSPGVFVTTVLVVALSIGANTTVFSLLMAVALRTLSVDEPERLVEISQVNGRGQLRAMPLSAVRAFEAQQTVFESVSAYIGGVLFTTESPGGVKSSGIELVDGDYFPMLGASPYLGRLISATEPEPVAVLGYRFWQRQFGAAPSAVGAQIRIEGQSFTIIGVTAPEHTGLRRDTAPDAVLPITQLGALMAGAATQPRANYLIAKLRREVSWQQAREQVSASWPAFAASLAGQPEPSLRAVVSPIGHGFSQLRDRYSTVLRALSALAAGMWLLVCVNIAALTLASAIDRLPEINLRIGLGASRRRVCRQMLIEHVVPTAVGALLAIPIASWAAVAISRLMWNGLSALTLDVAPDWRLVAIVSAAALATALVCGAVPLMALRHDLGAPPDRRVTSHARFGKGLQVVQVAISVCLMLGAAQLTRAAYDLRSADLGFRSENILLARLAALPAGYVGLDESTYYPELLRRVSQVRHVVAVSMSDVFPSVADERVALKPISADGVDGLSLVEVIAPGFFDVVGISRVAGRDFSWSDTRTTSSVAIVNASAAASLFGRADAIGRRVTLPSGRSSVTAEIVGVVADSSFGNPRASHVPAVFRPALQEPELARSPWLVIKADTGPLAIAEDVRRAVDAMGREFPREVRSFDAHVAGMRAKETVSSALALAFAVVGAAVAFIGLYGLLSYLAIRRKRELGIRIAIGASPARVAGRVVIEASVLTALGLLLSMPLSVWASRVLADVAAPDVTAFGVAVAACAALGVSASLVPAFRATRVDPVEVLRAE